MRMRTSCRPYRQVKKHGSTRYYDFCDGSAKLESSRENSRDFYDNRSAYTVNTRKQHEAPQKLRLK